MSNTPPAQEPSIHDMEVAIRDWLAPRIQPVAQWLFARPVVLVGIVLGISVVLSIVAFTNPLPVTPEPATPTVLPTTEVTALPVSDDVAALQVIVQYNRASIPAGMSGRTDALAPLLEPTGAAWTAIQQEFQRRAQTGETHEAMLNRWGVLAVHVAGGITATIETQEDWNDIVRVQNAIVRSDRGILSRATYTLHKSDAGWRITDVQSQTVVQ